MNTKSTVIVLFFFSTAIALAGTAAAMGPGGGMGGGHGMMGGGGHMMGNGGYMNSPGYSRPPAAERFQRRSDLETERLRSEVRERRQELSELFRQRPRDERLIDQKIEELSRLETELDRRTAGY